MKKFIFAFAKQTDGEQYELKSPQPENNRSFMILKNIILKLFILALCCFLTKTTTYAQCFNFDQNPKHEIRAVWLTTIGGLDWPKSYAQSSVSTERQKKELTDILDKLQKAKINTVLFQTRIRGTVIYPSDIEPWDACITGIPDKKPSYDPLAFAIEECHKRGMEIQAWVVAIPMGKWNSTGCRTLRKKHPSMLMKIGGYGYINPANEKAAVYISEICKEITKKYDIDGIHFDYIRYPETWKPNISLYHARNYITRIVKQTHDAVKSIKPWVKMSCSPIGKFDDLGRYSSRGWNAYNKGCQDTREWLRLGLMDQLYPMMYFKDNQFYPFAMDWKENCYGKSIAAGLGLYFLSPKEGNWNKEDITRQMYVSRAAGLGFAMFRNKFLLENTKGILDFIENDFNRYYALVPAIGYENKKRPNAPEWIKIKEDDRYEYIFWSNVTGDKGGVLYNVYASKNYPVDTEDAKNLIAVRLQRNELVLKKGNKMYYAVTAIDRYGNESYAVRSETPKNNTLAELAMIKNNGMTMVLPKKDKCLDAEYLIVKSLPGTIVATLPYKGTHADIRGIQDGIYTIHSLNRKGVTHRLGFIIIKRKIK